MDASSAIRRIEHLLVVNIPANLTDGEVVELRRATLDAARRHLPHRVLLDFTEVEVCDSFFGRFIHGMVEMVQLLGVSVIVCGLSDPVVDTLVDMGFDLPQVRAIAHLDDGALFSQHKASLSPRPPADVSSTMPHIPSDRPECPSGQ